MARYIVSYRISRYWGRIVAYLYRDNYSSNEVDISHNSQSPSASKLSMPSPSMPSATSTKGVSCSVAGAGKVTLIGSNCPASRVGRCVDCEGVRTAQVFSDCAITKYLSRATARLQKPCWITLDFKEHRPPARRRSPRRSPTTCSSDSVDRQNDGAPVLCAVACLLAVLTYGEALSDRIISYRIAIFCVISYRIESCPLWLYRAITTYLSAYHYQAYPLTVLQ